MNRLTKQIYLALFAAIALVIYTIELQLPAPVAIPGVKLGLANLVSLSVLLIYGPLEAIVVLLLRIVLGSLLTGQISALFFSLSGGFVSLICMSILLRFFKNSMSIWAISIVGGICHNITQLFVASLIVENVKIFFYLPVLMFSGVITGYFIGLASQMVAKHFKKMSIG